jgi:hypothetical protein
MILSFENATDSGIIHVAEHILHRRLRQADGSHGEVRRIAAYGDRVVVESDPSDEPRLLREIRRWLQEVPDSEIARECDPGRMGTVMQETIWNRRLTGAALEQILRDGGVAHPLFLQDRRTIRPHSLKDLVVFRNEPVAAVRRTDLLQPIEPKTLRHWGWFCHLLPLYVPDAVMAVVILGLRAYLAIHRFPVARSDVRQLLHLIRSRPVGQYFFGDASEGQHLRLESELERVAGVGVSPESGSPTIAAARTQNVVDVPEDMLPELLRPYRSTRFYYWIQYELHRRERCARPSRSLTATRWIRLDSELHDELTLVWAVSDLDRSAVRATSRALQVHLSTSSCQIPAYDAQAWSSRECFFLTLRRHTISDINRLFSRLADIAHRLPVEISTTDCEPSQSKQQFVLRRLAERPFAVVSIERTSPGLVLEGAVSFESNESIG